MHNVARELEFAPTHDMQDRMRRERDNREVSARLLARLLKFHGDRPPDADAQLAAEQIRAAIADARVRASRRNQPRSIS